MSLNSDSIRPQRLVPLMIVALVMASVSALAQVPDLEVKVGDTTGTPGEQNSVISVYAKNYADTIAGFEIWLLLNRDDIMEFQTDYQTVVDTSYWRCLDWYSEPDSCLDSLDVTDSVLLNPSSPYDWTIETEYQAYVGNHEVSNTLISDWEYVSSRSLTGLGYDLKIAAYANRIPPPYTPGIGYPQFGTTPLVKVLADIYPIPDTMTDRTVIIYVQATNLDNFSFSDQAGNAIGVITDTVPDTTWWICESWTEPDSICLVWTQVGEGPIDSVDSFWCCDTILTGRLDTSKVKIYNGSLEVGQGMCGDAKPDGLINILDITFLVNYL